MYFRFQDPIFALLIVLLILGFWLKRFWGRHASLNFSSNWALNRIVKRKHSIWRNALSLVRFFALVLIILALMRPQTGRKWSELTGSGVDIFLAIDLSGSMRAHDFESDGKLVSRLEIVKKVVAEFISDRPHDRIGIVAFAKEPYLVSPLTENHAWLQKNLERLEIGMIEPNSTAIGSAIGMGINRLRRFDSEAKLIILLTDGENNAGDLHPIAGAEAAKTLGIKIYTIGAGKTGSVLMPRVRSGQVVMQENGSPVMDWVESDIDENTLREVSRISEAEYFRATSTEGLQTIYSEIDQLEKREVSYIRYDEATDLMMLPLVLALGLILIEILLSRTIFHKLP
jgi:Ca-activated chloride channel family protein